MTDWRQQEECEERRWHEEARFCIFCGREVKNDGAERIVCCGSINHVETLEQSQRRWGDYDREFNHDHS